MRNRSMTGVQVAQEERNIVNITTFAAKVMAVEVMLLHPVVAMTGMMMVVGKCGEP